MLVALHHNHSIIAWAPSKWQADGNYGFNSKCNEDLQHSHINEAPQEKWDDDWKILQYLQPSFVIASPEEIEKKKKLHCVDESPRRSENQE